MVGVRFRLDNHWVVHGFRLSGEIDARALCGLIERGRPPRTRAWGRDEFVEVPYELVEYVAGLVAAREFSTRPSPVGACELWARPVVGLFWAVTTWLTADLAIRALWL